MVRFINCVRRREDVSPAEFRKFWQDDQFTELVERTAAIYKAEKWSKNLTLVIEANARILELRDSNPPYDGVIEYYWKTGRDIMNIFDSEEAIALNKEMTEFQSQFVNFNNSTLFFTEA
jgi:hypothetical protein